VTNTTWQLLTLEEIEKIEERLEKEKFKPQTIASIPKKWLDWITHTTVYSYGEESVAFSKYERTIFGHPIYTYNRGDVTIRIGEKNYRKLLLGFPT
jgi:hypothetical protein